MIREITIENFKSIASLKLELGRTNILIGANGSGKSNILEAIAFASAAGRNRLDNEFLTSRGIRVTEPRFMRSAFNTDDESKNISLALRDDDGKTFNCSLTSEQTQTYTRWRREDDLFHMIGTHGLELDAEGTRRLREMLQNFLDEVLKSSWESIQVPSPIKDEERRHAKVDEQVRAVLETAVNFASDYLIYSPENSALRVFQAESQILPFGVKGEGLFAHLKALNTPQNEPLLEKIIERLTLLEWFERFELPKDLTVGERTLRIRDRYLVEGALFDQRSANEGFLFLLFYFALFISPDTPAFFAIDNIDASLNPKLCAALMKALVELATKHNKQAILTTHNPALLDGLDLNDDEQRLFVIERSKSGPTRAHRVHAPKPVDGEPPVALSEAFLRGFIGGLPKNF